MDPTRAPRGRLRTAGLILRRAVLALVLMLGWIALPLGAVAAGQAGGGTAHTTLLDVAAAALVLVSAFYVVVATAWFATGGSWRNDLPAVGAVALLAAFFAALFGMAVGIGLPAWYLNHYGVEARAVVTAAHCAEGSGPACEQDLRVASAETGRDLGWVGCNGTGHRRTGEHVTVRRDPHGRIAPRIADCPRDAGWWNTMIGAALAGGGAAFALAAAVPFTARPPVPEDDPHWSPRSERLPSD